MKDNSNVLIGFGVVVVLVATLGWQWYSRRQAEALRQQEMAVRMAAQAEVGARKEAEALEQADKEGGGLPLRVAKIKKGMTEKEVSEIMGSPGREARGVQDLLRFIDLNIKTLEWGNEPFIFRCYFEDGKVTPAPVEDKPEPPPAK